MHEWTVATSSGDMMYLILHLPNVIVPNVHVPNTHVRKVHVPNVHVPNVHVPNVHVSGAMLAQVLVACERGLVPVRASLAFVLLPCGGTEP